MKKLLTVFILTVSTTSVLARDCYTHNLSREFDRINAIKGISSEEKDTLFKMSKAAKLSDILACSSFQSVYISAEQAVFAKYELNKLRVSDLEEIKSDERRLKLLLQDTNLDEHERDIYSKSLSEIPTRLQAVIDNYERLMLYINSSTL